MEWIGVIILLYIIYYVVTSGSITVYVIAGIVVALIVAGMIWSHWDTEQTRAKLRKIDEDKKRAAEAQRSLREATEEAQRNRREAADRKEAKERQQKLDEATRQARFKAGEDELRRLVLELQSKVNDFPAAASPDHIPMLRSVNETLNRIVKHELPLEENKFDDDIQFEVSLILKRLRDLGMADDPITHRIERHLVREARAT